MSGFSESGTDAGASGISVREVCNEVIERRKGAKLVQDTVTGFDGDFMDGTEGAVFGVKEGINICWVGRKKERVTVCHNRTYTCSVDMGKD